MSSKLSKNASVKRALSRPNAKRALARIEKELSVLIERSPRANEVTDEMWREEAKDRVGAGIRAVAYLYRRLDSDRQVE